MRKDEPPRVSIIPPALVLTGLLLDVAGLVVSAYLSFEHFTGATTLSCPDTGRVNCLKVTTSSYSTFAGAPVAVLGVTYFLALLPLLTPTAWRNARLGIRAARFAGVILGVLMALYLVWAEVHALGAICLWCTAVHLIAFALFGVVVFSEALREEISPDA